MYHRVDYLWRPGPPFLGVTISPDGEPAAVEEDGDVNLFPQASRVFSQLAHPNVFTGEVNTFRDVVARRVHVTSDAGAKRDAVPLDGAASLALVRRLVPHAYRLDGRAAAGVLAQDVPPQYVTRVPDGTLTVDYAALLAELWAAVRYLAAAVADDARRR